MTSFDIYTVKKSDSNFTSAAMKLNDIFFV